MNHIIPGQFCVSSESSPQSLSPSHIQLREMHLMPGLSGARCPYTVPQVNSSDGQAVPGNTVIIDSVENHFTN